MTEPARGVFSLLAVAAVLATNLRLADGGEGSPVYRWVDTQGEVHFSDIRPPEGAIDVRTTSVAPLPARAPGDDFYSVVNQLKRMQERRLAAERARREARMESLESNYQRQYGWRSWYYGPYAPYAGYSGFGYAYSGFRDPHRRWHSLGPGYRPLPSHHAIGRPPLRHSVGSRNVSAIPLR